MATVKEQIGRKCKHFNGIMNDKCEAGVRYADVRVDRPYKFPCLQQGGECSKCEFLTPEEVAEKEKEILNMGMSALIASATIKNIIEKSGSSQGEVDCTCGGKIKYIVASVNGHIRAACNKCQISFNE